MVTSSISAQSRAAALKEMSAGVDVVVIGGGVTGAGVALDAATRGLRTAIVEAEDWASGTSSQSTKLVHGGLRYLDQLNFRLVAESLRERGLLLTTTAPHLVKPLPLIWPLKSGMVERAYSALGIAAYDTLAFAGAGGKLTVPPQKHLGKADTLARFPSLRSDILTGAIRFFDSRVDDARLVVTIVRTAVRYGALAASRTRVVGLLRENGRVVGAEVLDTETGEHHQVRARHVVSATGVWTGDVEAMSASTGGPRVLASKGVHLLFPRSAIEGETGIFVRTKKSILGLIPWDRYWIVGTTDTAWHERLEYPVPTSADVHYLLKTANEVLRTPLTRDDIIGTYAGLRPLVQPAGSAAETTKVSRDHVVQEVVPGLTVVVGGKLTTYRAMAEDTVDALLGDRARTLPSITKSVPLTGAEGYRAVARNARRIAERYGWTEQRVAHLLDRYGADVTALLDLVDREPALGQPLESADAYLAAEVVFAVLHEGALHLDDVLVRRVRLNMETRDRGQSAVPEIGSLMGPLLGWSDEDQAREQEQYLRRARAERAAEEQTTDADAVAVRQAGDTPDAA